MCDHFLTKCLKIESKIKGHQNENPSNPSCMTQEAPYIPMLLGLGPKLWSVTLKLCQRAKLNVPDIFYVTLIQYLTESARSYHSSTVGDDSLKCSQLFSPLIKINSYTKC